MSNNHSRSMSGEWNFTDHGVKRLENSSSTMNEKLDYFNGKKLPVQVSGNQLKSTNNSRHSYSWETAACTGRTSILCWVFDVLLPACPCPVIVILSRTRHCTQCLHKLVNITERAGRKEYELCHYIWLIMGQCGQCTLVLYITLKF